MLLSFLQTASPGWPTAAAEFSGSCLHSFAGCENRSRQFLSVCGCIAGAVAILFVAVFRSKLLCGERNPGEHLTGVLTATGIVAALLGGDAVLCHRHNDLGIPFQTDNRELPQAHIQPPILTAEHQFLIKHIQNTLGNLNQVAFLALADLPHPGRQHHRLQNLHNGGG